MFEKIFLQFFLFPIRKNAWIKIFFTKFEGNIDNIRGEAENISILPENLVKKIEIQAFFLIGIKKNCRKIFEKTLWYWTLLFKILTIFLGTRWVFWAFLLPDPSLSDHSGDFGGRFWHVLKVILAFWGQILNRLNERFVLAYCDAQ